ncbi:MAG: hypothetical protein AAGA90_10510 [Actinomycetota bacterium]
MGVFDGIRRWARDLSDRTIDEQPAVRLRRRGESTVRVLPFGGHEHRHLEVVFPNSISDPDHPFVFDGDLGGLLDDAWTSAPDTVTETSETIVDGIVTQTTVYRSADGRRVLRRVDQHREGADTALDEALTAFRSRYPDAVIDADHVEIDLDLDRPVEEVLDDMQGLARQMIESAHVCVQRDESPEATRTAPPEPVAPEPEPHAGPEGVASLDESDVLDAVFDASIHTHERRSTIVPRYLGETVTWSVEVESSGRSGDGAKIHALIGHVGDTGRYSDRVRGEISTTAPADVARGDEITVRAVIGAIDVYSRTIELLDAQVVDRSL